MDVSIRASTATDLPEVLSVLDEAAAWLQSIGMTRQWPAVVSQDEQWVALLTQFAAEGRVHVAESGDGSVVGVFLLRDEAGPNDRVWTVDEAAAPAAYLYRLAVRRGVAGQGVAAGLLLYAIELARASGRVLRLDCWAGNDALRRYYVSAGFEYRGDVEMLDQDGRAYSVSRFQRSA